LVAHLSLYLPLYLTLTYPSQEALRAASIMVFDLYYAKMQPLFLGLPAGFYHFVRRNYFRSFFAF